MAAGQGPVCRRGTKRPDFGATGIHEWHSGQNWPPPHVHLTPSLLACTTMNRMRHPWWRRAVGCRENGCPRVCQCVCTPHGRGLFRKHETSTQAKNGLYLVARLSFRLRAPRHTVGSRAQQRSAGEVTIADSSAQTGGSQGMLTRGEIRGIARMTFERARGAVGPKECRVSKCPIYAAIRARCNARSAALFRRRSPLVHPRCPPPRGVR